MQLYINLSSLIGSTLEVWWSSVMTLLVVLCDLEVYTEFPVVVLTATWTTMGVHLGLWMFA